MEQKKIARTLNNVETKFSILKGEDQTLFNKIPKESGEGSFEENLELFINLLFAYKGEISEIQKEFPVTSFGTEFVERAKSICRKKDLILQEKVLNTIKDAIYQSKKLNLLQASVLHYMADLIFISEELSNLDYEELQAYFYEIKETLTRDYGNIW
ncbi:MAG: hypothetical protein NZ903_00150 [Candidatus Micrarchaeota archaeon]|nr:hypothetical protein [Candidatus Micrarchaeota archaeon]